MPQLIAFVVGVVIVSYLVLYALTLALYALIFAVPAVALMWLTSFLILTILEHNSQLDICLSLDASGALPRLQKTIRRKSDEGYTILACLLGVSISGCLLYFLGDYVERAGGSDPVWIKRVGLWVAWVIFAVACIWVYGILHRRKQVPEVHALTNLDPFIERFTEQLDRAMRASAVLGIRIDHPGWGFIQSASGKTNGAEDEISKRLDQQSAFYRSAADDYEIMSAELIQIRSLTQSATVKAAQSKSRSLIILVDGVAEQLESYEFQRVITERNLNKFRCAVDEMRQALKSVLDHEVSGSENDSNGKKRQFSGSSANEPMMSTVAEALDLLGLKPEVSQETIKDRIKKLRMVHHPDRLKDLVEEERMSSEKMIKLINIACDILSKAGRV